MICKAIVETKLSDYKLKVRIPVFHKHEESVGCTATLDVPEATICTTAGIYPSLSIGDVVFVCFEDDNVDKPVIVGVLYSNNCKNIKSDISANSLEVLVNATLPDDTTIGEVTSKSISCLYGTSSNIEKHFNDNDRRIKKIEVDGCGETTIVLERIEEALRSEINK